VSDKQQGEIAQPSAIDECRLRVDATMLSYGRVTP
jgi:hypothetical protein